ncbi:c-type cytochrome [Congregibacter litoralis]|uniref:Cytochrome c553 n=1 Tax=Congregibacter litoralis KT71 TaxID=314285 RepID=A4A6I2_9GAMM|nr:c-type cytochrome [Congregibacter litoralis]EAQ98629.1 Cytochrome c553 [Congregibacter litoralis KT71]
MKALYRLRFLGVVFLLLAASAQSAEPQALFDPADYEYCLVCHGGLGQGNPAIQAPVLAGMEGWSLRNQLQAFREGWRGKHPLDLVGMEMRPVALALDEEEIADVTSYLEQLAPQVAPQAATDSSTGDPVLGRSIYVACIACHGEAAEGKEALQAPALAYQDERYLERQLRHFRDGVRGSHPDDARGATMAASAAGLDDAAIANVVSYIRTLTR